MAGGSWGMGSRPYKRSIHYRVLCPVCATEAILTKRQYLNQLKFKCMECQALRPIREDLSERVLY